MLLYFTQQLFKYNKMTNFNCPLLEEQIEELRLLINQELQTTPYLVDWLIAKLLYDLRQDYVNNYANQIKKWKTIISVIKEQLVQGSHEINGIERDI